MKKLHEIEDFLRNGKPPEKDMTGLRYQVWQRILNAQRQRRESRTLLKLPPWIWTLASIILVLLCILAFILMK